MKSPTSSKRPRWLRYSLRTFMVALTALCIWFGILATRAHRQAEAVSAIRAAGGIVIYDYETSSSIKAPDQDAVQPGPRWLRRLIGDDFLRSVAYVELQGDGITDKLVAQNVTALSHLKRLYIESPNISDHSLKSLAALRELESLEVVSPEITVDGLRQLEPARSLSEIRVFHNPASRRAANALRDRTPVDMVDVPLTNALEFLEIMRSVTIRFDANPEPAPPVPLVTAKLAKCPLSYVLSQLLSKSNLDYVVKLKDGDIIIASPTGARQGWPGHETLHSLFPDLYVLETDW